MLDPKATDIYMYTYKNHFKQNPFFLTALANLVLLDEPPHFRLRSENKLTKDASPGGENTIVFANWRGIAYVAR